MKTPLQYWTDHKNYILGLMESDPSTDYTEDLEEADYTLSQIANGTYEASVILHSSLTLYLSDTQL